MSETTLQEVERLLDQMTPEEQIAVVEHLVQRLRMAVLQRPPQDLYGIWREHFPPDFDIDAALKEIRQGWTSEWPEGADK